MSKYILEIKKADGEITRTEHKSLKDIQKQFPNFEYFQIRALYKYCEKPTKAHPHLKQLAERVRIVDKPFDI